MAIDNGADLKVAQVINLPSAVTAMNIFYFKAVFTDPKEEAVIITELEQWIETVYSTVLSQVSDLVTLGEFVLYQWNTVLAQWDNKGAGEPSVTFLGATDMLPHGVAAMVRAYSVEPRTIGRKYIPGLLEEAQADGVWAGGALTALAAFGNAWDNPANISPSNDLVPGVWTTKYFTVYPLSGTEVVLVNPAYQRRRRPGVGI